MGDVVVIACRNTLINEEANSRRQPACQQDAQTPGQVLFPGRSLGSRRETFGE